MITPEVSQAIDKVLREQLSGIGFEGADVSEDFDHDGDPILNIVVHYRRVGPSIDPTPTFSIIRHLRHELQQLGETRFPHFWHEFPEHQQLKVA